MGWTIKNKCGESGSDEVKAVLDTNAVIYLQKGWLEVSLPPGEYLISVITEIELLSFAGLNNEQRSWLQRLIDDLDVVEIDWAVKQCTIALRRDHRLKLPDALIAATAITRDAVLLTNDAQLAAVPELRCQMLKLRDVR
jgi:predicted nucleic acid-binding protein